MCHHVWAKCISQLNLVNMSNFSIKDSVAPEGAAGDVQLSRLPHRHEGFQASYNDL